MSENNIINLDLSQELQAFLRLLKRRQLAVITVASVIFLLVAVWTFVQKPTYRATVAIAIDMETPNLLAIYTSRDDATMAQTNYMTYADYYRTQLEILKSRRLGEMVYNSLRLDEKPQYSQKDDPIKELMDQIDVEPVKQTRLVLLRATDNDPQKATDIANETAKIFVEQNLARTARSETLNLMKNEYLSLQSKEAELSKRYKPKFPARARVREQLQQLSAAIEQEARKEEGRMQASDTKTGEITAGGFGTAGPLDKSSLRPNNIWIQTPAHVPLKPYRPIKSLNLALGLIFGLICGIAVAAIEEFFDATIKNSNDISDLTKVPFLGHVPRMPDLMEGQSAAKQRYQIMHEDSQSEIAEAYRVIRTNLLCVPRGKEGSALLVTSPGSEEGKTTTTCNLAIALAQTGVSVLLVDADLRKPSVHKAFEMNASPGLSEYLSGKANFEEIIHSTAVDRLFVVTSGSIPKNPSELLGSLKMKEFHHKAVAKYNYVLIDTAPIIPVTDATILASMTQTVLTIAQSGKTPREAFKRMLSICEGLNANIVGIILNKVPMADLTGYGYGYQIYSYGKSSGRRISKRSLSGLLETVFQKAKRWYADYLSKRSL